MQFFAREGVVGGARAGQRPQRSRRDPRRQRAAPVPRRQGAADCRRRSIVASEHYNRIARLLERNMPVHDRAERPEPLRRRHARLVQHHRRDSGHRQGRRGRDARRALRLVARRHRRHRQRRRLGGDDGGDAHPEGHRPAAAAHGAAGALDRRGAGPARLARLREAAVRRSATTMELKPAHAKLSAYFNMDNGTGAIRGVYLQGNEAVRPIFAAWMEPFRNLGMTTLTIRNTGGTDHVAVRRGRPARLPVHPGSARVRHATRITRTWTSTTGCRRRT